MKLLLSILRHPATDIVVFLALFFGVSTWDLDSYTALACGCWGIMALERHLGNK